MKFIIYDTVDKRYIEDSTRESVYIRLDGKVVSIHDMCGERYEENPDRYVLILDEGPAETLTVEEAIRIRDRSHKKYDVGYYICCDKETNTPIFYCFRVTPPVDTENVKYLRISESEFNLATVKNCE